METTELSSALLLERYTYLGELGEGASGRVILVEDQLAGDRRAAKVVSATDAQRLSWELEILAGVSHDGLARVFELVTTPEAMPPPFALPQGAAVLVQELAPGAEAVRAVGALADAAARVRFVVELGLTVARALRALHAVGLVHGDVKPANIVVDERPGRAKLVDLGLARPFGRAVTVSGTPLYLAPEAWLGERSVATDLFALGATLHDLLMDVPGEGTASGVSTASLRLEPRTLRVEELPWAVPPALRRLIGALTASEPGLRPSNAGEVAARLGGVASELGLVVEGIAAVADEPSPRERAARAGVARLTGRESERNLLLDRLDESGLLIVAGPPGAGRTRLIHEAVRELQRRSVRDGRPAATYVRGVDGPPSVAVAGAVVHIDGAVHVDACRSAVEAAAVGGLSLTVVLEVRDHPDADIVVGPLTRDGIAQLLRELLGREPGPSLCDAAWEVSSGLPGRLCRLVAEAHLAGLDPRRPAALRQVAASLTASAEVAVPSGGLRLAKALALAGGALAVTEAARVEARVGERLPGLFGAGIAHEGEAARIQLRPDLVSGLFEATSQDERAEIAERLASGPLETTAEAFVRLCLQETDTATSGFLQVMRQAREEGDPERAASVGCAAIERFLEAPLALRLATADALRARARIEEALGVLEGATERSAGEARAELLRISGSRDRARSEAERIGGQHAAITLARLAIDEGDAESALALLSSSASSDTPDQSETVSAGALGDVWLRARRVELRALAALLVGDNDRALEIVQRGHTASLPKALEARALATEGLVLSAFGRVDQACATYARAHALADAAGERLAAASYLVNVGLGRLERGLPGPALVALREGARQLTRIGRRADAGRALYNLANAAALVGDDDLAGDAVTRAHAWCEERSDLAAVALCAVLRAELWVRAGRLEAAAALLRDHRDDALPATVQTIVRARLAIVEVAVGRLDEGAELVEALYPSTDDPLACIEVTIARARVALARPDPDAARAHAEGALALAARVGWEGQVRAAIIAAEIYAAFGGPSAGPLAMARALLDQAGATLSPAGRARLRAVPAYARALGVQPTRRVESSVKERLHRVLVAGAKRLVRETRRRKLDDAIVDLALELADAERGFLAMVTESGSIELRSARSFGADLRSEERPSTSVVHRAHESGRLVVTVDAQTDAQLDGAASIHAMALRSILAVPISSSPPTVIVLDDRLRPAAFDEEVTRAVVDLAAIAAGATERVEALQRERREKRRLERARLRLARQVETAERELADLRRSAPPAFAGIVAESAPMRRILQLVSRVASSGAPVLVRGESGTGKELIARAVHDAGPRRSAPYVGENVGAVPESLVESTLFGHVRGAFTGADSARRGLFEMADGGTLFLDEIGEMSEAMQAKLLRVVQEGELRPVGSENVRRVDVRLVTATHRDLERAVAEGRFREDLYYRIAVITLEVPPLRDRPDDIASLVGLFLERHGAESKRKISPEAMRLLQGAPWPGNVRQLENEVRRALVLADDRIEVGHLSPELGGDDGTEEAGMDLKAQVASLERRLIRSALEETGGNRTRAAAQLGVSRYGLQKMIKRLGLLDEG